MHSRNQNKKNKTTKNPILKIRNTEITKKFKKNTPNAQALTSSISNIKMTLMIGEYVSKSSSQTLKLISDLSSNLYF